MQRHHHFSELALVVLRHPYGPKVVPDDVHALIINIPGSPSFRIMNGWPNARELWSSAQSGGSQRGPLTKRNR